jgi:Zn-dependent protease with chaperone function
LAVIPLSFPRLFLMLLGVSALIALPEMALERTAMSRETMNILLGAFYGLTVFLLALMGGKVLGFCAKGRVADLERLQKVFAALAKIGIPDGRYSIAVTIVEYSHLVSITVREGRGHRIFMSAKMIDALGADALRGVLAHEYGHIRNGHPLKLVVLLGLVAAVKMGLGVPLPAVICVFMAYLYMLRQWEYQADAMAVTCASRDDMLAAFAGYRQLELDRDLSPFLEWFCAHPSMHKRIAAIDVRSTVQMMLAK